MKLTIYKAEFTAAFWQTGIAQRDLYVRLPTESPLCYIYLWPLLTATHGLFNATSKWQNISNSLIKDLGLIPSLYIPLLSYRKEAGQLASLVAKMFDYMKVPGVDDYSQKFLTAFNKIFSFVEVNHGSGNLRFFGINTIQDTNYTIQTNAHDTLHAVSECQLSRPCRKQAEETVNSMEQSAFATNNSSLRWIGIASLPFVLVLLQLPSADGS